MLKFPMNPIEVGIIGKCECCGRQRERYGFTRTKAKTFNKVCVSSVCCVWCLDYCEKCDGEPYEKLAISDVDQFSFK